MKIIATKNWATFIISSLFKNERKLTKLSDDTKTDATNVSGSEIHTCN